MANNFEIIDDIELTERIKGYQELHGISSFEEAVKRLCDDALEIEKIRHWGDFPVMKK